MSLFDKKPPEEFFAPLAALVQKIEAVGTPSFDLKDTLKHLEQMAAQIPFVSIYLNHHEFPNPSYYRSTMRLTEYIVAQYEFHQLCESRYLFGHQPASRLPFDTQKLYDLLQALFTMGIDVNAVSSDSSSGGCALFLAAECGDTTLLTFLLDSGARADRGSVFGMNCFNDACLRGRLETVKILIAYGADVNLQSKTHTCESPVFAAAHQWQLDTLKLLFEHGADLNQCSKSLKNQAPLLSYTITESAHGADPEKQLAMIHWMIEQGADINALDRDGRPALHHAVYGNSKLVPCLLSHGATLNVKNKLGNTELHIAARRNSPDFAADLAILDLLISSGSNLFAVNHQGKTPYDLAINQDRSEVADFLMSCQKAIEEKAIFEELFNSSRTDESSSFNALKNQPSKKDHPGPALEIAKELGSTHLVLGPITSPSRRRSL